jgi:DNA-binding NarL/FixJ family response regulator
MHERVLIVDDHDGFRAVARKLLSGAGFDVVGEAADGRAGLAAARATRPDVVLLDVQLPDVDGFRVAAELAAGPQPPAVVLVSTRSSDEYGGLIGRSPARGFIAKAELTGSRLRAVLRD